ncbi:MAG: VIT1/CCC1 transporter family protein [Candidatus Asgardarchaeia archaeon]
MFSDDESTDTDFDTEEYLENYEEEKEEEEKRKRVEEKTSFFKKIKMYIEISGVSEIGRRYFVMNAFDGALTMLGIIIGAAMAGNIDPRIIISAGIGGSVAMGVSGFTGAYITERAERLLKLRELEESLGSEIEDTIIEEASSFASIIAALIDGISPALAALVSIIPYVLSSYGLIAVSIAFYSSIAVNLGLLFVLGMFLGRLSKENSLVYAGIMVLVGIVTALLTIFLIGGHTI